MRTKSYGRLKLACYTTNISMSAVANLAPILFLGFRELYGISYALLGLLVLVNFSTQLLVDLIFSFCSHKIDMSIALKMTPVLTVVGLSVFAAAPLLFPAAPFVGLLIGTVIYAASGGLGEVLISPVIAALPSENPEREVSKLHSIYAWGVVFIVPVCSLVILLFGTESWQWLSLGCAAIPLAAALLFVGTELPELETPERVGGATGFMKSPTLWLSVVGIFLGGASECIMAQWSSSYIEGALGIDKIYGDIFGVALFAAMLGLGRSLYAKMGRAPERILFFGAIGASVCYLVAALFPSPIVGLIACALTGLCTSMLWPGSLIIAEERMPTGGVFLFAMMAAGGDLGASVGPQLVGAIADAASGMTSLAAELGMSGDELGLKIGMLTAALFPIAAIFVYLRLVRTAHRGQSNVAAVPTEDA